MRLLSGAVCSEQRRASAIGTDILARGGNAVDAIIATTIAVNTLAPFHSDLGGGGFAVVRTPEGGYEGLDFRHVAPVRRDLVVQVRMRDVVRFDPGRRVLERGRKGGSCLSRVAARQCGRWRQ
jgi:gamma-glutamyltranspeptidase